MFDDISDIDDINIENLTTSDEVKSSNSENKSNYKFVRKEEKEEEPYIAMCIYIDKTTPSEKKEEIFKLCSMILNKKYIIRINAECDDLIPRLFTLNKEAIEVYKPWKKFGDIESKHYYSGVTANYIASQAVGASWDKFSLPAKGFLSRNVRMLFGDKNRSTASCLITWSKDGASKVHEVNRETGGSSFIIKLAAKYGINVVNVGKPSSSSAFIKHYDLES